MAVSKIPFLVDVRSNFLGMPDEARNPGEGVTFVIETGRYRIAAASGRS